MEKQRKPRITKSYWLGVRLTPAQQQKLLGLATALGTPGNMSGAVRRLIDGTNLGAKGGRNG